MKKTPAQIPAPEPPKQTSFVLPVNQWKLNRAEALAEGIRCHIATENLAPVGDWIQELRDLWPTIINK